MFQLKQLSIHATNETTNNRVTRTKLTGTGAGETVNLVNFRDEAPLSSSPCCTRNTVVNRIDETIRLSLTYFTLLTNSHGNYAVSQRIQPTLRTGHATLVVLPTIPRR